jgi:hypothetical protein
MYNNRPMWAPCICDDMFDCTEYFICVDVVRFLLGNTWRQRLETCVWGSVSTDLLQWVPTPKLLPEQLEHFACGYVARDDFADLEACLVRKDPDTLVYVEPRDTMVDNGENLTDLPTELSSSHLSTMRMTASDYLQARQQLVTNVAPIQSEEEVALFVELLREHLPQRPSQSIDWIRLTREFNRRVLRRPPGTALRLKTHSYIRDYAKHLMKRVQVVDAQQSLLSKVRLIVQI